MIPVVPARAVPRGRSTRSGEGRGALQPLPRSFYDRDTLAVVEFTSTRCVFTMEGTDHDEPATWVFTLDGKESNIVWLFTQYYTLSS